MKRIFVLLVSALCLVACSQNPRSPKESLEQALKAENGIEFTVSDLTPIDTVTIQKELEMRYIEYSQTIEILKGKLTDGTAEAEDVKSFNDRIVQSQYLLENLTTVAEELKDKYNTPAFIDYQFSAAPADGSDSIVYTDAYCSIAYHNNKLLGISGMKSKVRKNRAFSIPGLEEFIIKAQGMVAE